MKVFFQTADLDELVLDTEKLTTTFDTIRPSYGEQQARKGAELVVEGFTMTISENGVWNAHSPDRLRHIHSYEKLGYHAHTKSLLEGFVRAGGNLVVYGFEGIQGKMVRWQE